jgi:hypothetical protein
MNGATKSLARAHLRIGWWGLLFFLVMGIGLELLHALKLGFYVDVQNDSRRLLWTLAHAHGTLIALVHFGFATTIIQFPDWADRGREWASKALIVALVLIPGGFFLGGAMIYSGDPGPGIFLLPVGAIALFAGTLATALGSRRAGDDSD